MNNFLEVADGIDTLSGDHLSASLAASTCCIVQKIRLTGENRSLGCGSHGPYQELMPWAASVMRQCLQACLLHCMVHPV
jgi:hypothetical protein